MREDMYNIPTEYMHFISKPFLKRYAISLSYLII